MRHKLVMLAVMLCTGTAASRAYAHDGDLIVYGACKRVTNRGPDRAGQIHGSAHIDPISIQRVGDSFSDARPPAANPGKGDGT